MCIIKTEAWAYAGTNYTTEKDAVKAALTDIGTRLIKEFHSNPLQGLLALGAEVSELRDRYMALLDLELHPEQAPSKKAGEDPSPLVPIADRREEVRRRMDNLPPGSTIIDAIAVHLKDEKWPSAEAFLVHADGQQLQFVERLLTIGKA